MTHIRGAAVYDGSGSPSFSGDILLEGDRIAAVGAAVPVPPGALRIDAAGLAAAPGFIDMHGHNDLRVFSDPVLEPKLLQGITTEVIGQDGISMAPIPAALRESWRSLLAEFDGEDPSLSLDFPDAAAYLSALGGLRPAANYCYFAPHGNLRAEALGLDRRRAEGAGLAAMKAALSRDLDAGSFGLSTGLIYAPCSFADGDELAALCSVVADRNGLFMIHQRSEADDILGSMEEVLDLGRRSGVRVHFSHFKVCGKKNAGKVDAMLGILDKARSEGLRVSFDQYPYVAGSTSLGVALPPWSHDGGPEALLRRLQDRAARDRMRADISSGLPGWDNFVDFAGCEGILLNSSPSGKNTALVGKSLAEIALIRGVDGTEALMDLVLEEENRATMVDFYGYEESAELLMVRPEMCASTDGILDERPHPRVHGAFPRILGRYCRDKGLFSLEEAVAKLSGRSAALLGLRDRGLIRPGYFADLVLFDPKTIACAATFEEPTRKPVGISYVFVNGELAAKDGARAGARAGRVLSPA